MHFAAYFVLFWAFTLSRAAYVPTCRETSEDLCVPKQEAQAPPGESACEYKGATKKEFGLYSKWSPSRRGAVLISLNAKVLTAAFSVHNACKIRHVEVLLTSREHRNIYLQKSLCSSEGDLSSTHNTSCLLSQFQFKCCGPLLVYAYAKIKCNNLWGETLAGALDCFDDGRASKCVPAKIAPPCSGSRGCDMNRGKCSGSSLTKSTKSADHCIAAEPKFSALLSRLSPQNPPTTSDSAEVYGDILSDTRSTSRISTADVTAASFTETNPVPESLFGLPRNLTSTSDDLKPGVHPRIAFSALEWDRIVSNYAETRTTPGSWSKHFMDYTQNKGPVNPVLNYWATLNTSAYTGEYGMNADDLKSLAMNITIMSEYNEGGFFMYALHASVNDRMISNGVQGYLPAGQDYTAAISVIVTYSKIILSHYATFGCSNCTYVPGFLNSDIWQASRVWGVANDWFTGGLGIALSYDVLYDKMSPEQRRFVQSAIGMMVKDRQHWGITDTSDIGSPNVLLHPHRIFSNWATYHANLYLTNLAIEGEDDFDDMTTNVGVGFNLDIDMKATAIYDAYMKHSVYPEGSTFEDGYTYNVALREGSLGFIALGRRGYNLLNTPRFRNFIHNCAQMFEPYRCGHFVGHSGGGGELYNTFQGLFRYTYPDGELTNMMWRQRMGASFLNFRPCRITYHQNMMQISILGGEHGAEIESPSGLSLSIAKDFPLSLYQPRRGLLIARSDLSEEALYFHFDARPDATFCGHDNADRGTFTLTALRRTWIPDLPWHIFPHSQHHSLMHIDGQAQALKAPSVRMLKVKAYGDVVLAAADLTYAYNVQWARAWTHTSNPRYKEMIFTNGTSSEQYVTYVEKENGQPTAFGWPSDDSGSDLGFAETTSLWGEPDIGFRGLYNWKRDYREVPILRGVRSAVLVRSQGGLGYVLIGDNFAMSGTGLHSFQSYVVLAPDMSIVSNDSCTENQCRITLSGGVNLFLDIHIATQGRNVSYVVDRIGTNYLTSRLVISSKNRNSEKVCMVLSPYREKPRNFSLTNEEDICTVSSGDIRKSFRFSSTDHSLEMISEETSAST